MVESCLRHALVERLKRRLTVDATTASGVAAEEHVLVVQVGVPTDGRRAVGVVGDAQAGVPPLLAYIGEI